MSGHIKEYLQATGMTATYMFCLQLFHPLLSPYIKSLGFTELEMGMLFAVFPIVMIFASPILGSLSDHLGRREVILIGLGAEIAAIMLFIFDTYTFMIYIARFLEAAAYAAVVYSGLALVEDNVKKKRGKMSGWALSIMQSGQLIAPVIGGILADRFGVKFPMKMSIIALIILLIALLFSPKKHGKITITDFNLITKTKEFLKHRELQGMAIIGFAMHASIPLTFVYFPLYIMEHFGLSFKYVGYMSFALMFMHLFQFALGEIADKIKHYRAILAGTSIMAISFIFLSQAEDYWLFIGIVFLSGIGTALWNVSAITFMSDIGEKLKIEGQVLGSYVSLAKIGGALSYLVSGAVVYYYGTQTLMIGAGAFILIMAAITYNFIKPRRQKVRVKSVRA